VVLGLSSEGRPTGISILAILEAIIGVYYLVTGFAEFTSAIIRSLTLSSYPYETIHLIHSILGTMLIIVGLISILLAWGLWTGKGWARMVALVFAILGIIMDLIPPFHIIGLVIEAVIVYYLTRPNVKQFFTK